MIGGCGIFCDADVLVVRVRHDLRVMWGIVITENVLTVAHIRIGVMDAHPIAQLGADDLVNIQVGIVPEKDPASQQTVVIV